MGRMCRRLAGVPGGVFGAVGGVLAGVFGTVAISMMTATVAMAQVSVRVTNTVDLDRRNETVEVMWDELSLRVEGVTPENVIVTWEDGEIPSQVVFEGSPQPKKLIFQTSLFYGQTREYKISTGMRSAYQRQAYGRFVPERKDDYAWENNLVAFRAYGPALRVELVTGGIDYWAKNTQKMVIDEWYERDLSGRGSYHADHGEGCDCYKVGPTMGAGSSMVWVKDKYVSPGNFETWQVLDNGPVRTTVRFTYREWITDVESTPNAPRMESGRVTKIISLDANSYFNKVTEMYGGSLKRKNRVVVGMAVHPRAEVVQRKGHTYVFEPASDSQSGQDGSIGVAVIVPGRSKDIYMAAEEGLDPQVGKVVKLGRSRELVYYTGAVSTKGGLVKHGGDWGRIVLQKEQAISKPLKIEIK